MNQPKSIPRPLVRTNQWTIFLSVIATWITGQEWVLLIPLIAGLLGLLFDYNPVMRIAKLFLSRQMNAYIPEDKDQQQFNQLIATTLLALGFIGYLGGWMIVAYAATVMVALASFIAILGFCIGCFIRYQWLQYRHRRTQNNQ